MGLSTLRFLLLYFLGVAAPCTISHYFVQHLTLAPRRPISASIDNVPGRNVILPQYMQKVDIRVS